MLLKSNNSLFSLWSNHLLLIYRLPIFLLKIIIFNVQHVNYIIKMLKLLLSLLQIQIGLQIEFRLKDWVHLYNHYLPHLFLLSNIGVAHSLHILPDFLSLSANYFLHLFALRLHLSVTLIEWDDLLVFLALALFQLIKVLHRLLILLFVLEKLALHAFELGVLLVVQFLKLLQFLGLCVLFRREVVVKSVVLGFSIYCKINKIFVL